MENVNMINELQPIVPQKKKEVWTTVIKIIMYSFLIAYIIILVVPFIWGAITTLKTVQDFNNNNALFGLPREKYGGWDWKKFSEVFDLVKSTYTNDHGQSRYFYLPEMMMNSVLYSATAAFAGTTTVYIVAYARTMYSRFKIMGVFDVIVLTIMTLPVFGTLPSSIRIFKMFGLFENFIGIAFIARISFQGMYFFVISAQIRAIPKAYCEAAEIDGAGELTKMFKVMIPLTISIYLVIYVMKFIQDWNSYSNIYVFLKNYPTAAYGLWQFRQSSSTVIKDGVTVEASHTSYKLCCAIIVVAPVLTVFAIFHKKIMGGISLSEGVKE